MPTRKVLKSLPFSGWMQQNYGRKAGWLRTSLSQTKWLLGGYQKLRVIDPNRVDRLVFACRGNICRSPYGELRALQMGWSATSFGTHAHSNDRVPAQALRVASQRGLHLESHRPRALTEVQTASGDLILCFEPGQAQYLRKLFAHLEEGQKPQISLIGLFAPIPRPHVEDPFLLSDDYFDACYALVDKALVKLTDHLLRPRAKKTHVLVSDAHTMGALASARSLGRAGYNVHITDCDAHALALDSNYADFATTCPSYKSPSYLSWLDDYIREMNIQCIVPTESFLLKVRPLLPKYAPSLPFSSNPKILYSGLSKFDLFDLFSKQPENIREHLPPHVLLEGANDSTTALTEFASQNAGPYFVKVDAQHARTPFSRSQVVPVEDLETLQAVCHDLSAEYSKVLIQSFVPGKGVGAFFILWKGQVVEYFMHQRLHEVPHTGGYSSLRCSFYKAEILQDALHKLQALRWEGPAMMEYRYDEASQKFFLMELNGRFWGSLHLPLTCGVDFPKALVRAHQGFYKRNPIATFDVHRPLHYPLGVQSRWTFPAEVQHLVSVLRDTSMSGSARLNSLGNFIKLSVLMFLPWNRVHEDLFFAGDNALFFANAKMFIKTVIQNRKSK